MLTKAQSSERSPSPRSSPLVSPLLFVILGRGETSRRKLIFLANQKNHCFLLWQVLDGCECHTWCAEKEKKTDFTLRLWNEINVMMQPGSVGIDLNLSAASMLMLMDGT